MKVISYDYSNIITHKKKIIILFRVRIPSAVCFEIRYWTFNKGLHYRLPVYVDAGSSKFCATHLTFHCENFVKIQSF